MGVFANLKRAILGDDADGDINTSKEPRKAPIEPTTTPGGAAKRGNEDYRPMSEAEVTQRLETMPNAGSLNWRSSIVDLMKLVGIDPSYENREELAHEMGNPDYSGSAEDNIKLHEQVMRRMGLNRGAVPRDLKD